MDQDVSDELQVIHEKLEHVTTDLAVIRANYATKTDLAAFRAETAIAFGKVHERISSEVGKVNERISTEIGKVNERISSEIGKVNERITAESGRLEASIARLEASLMRWFIATVFTAVAASAAIARCFQ